MLELVNEIYETKDPIVIGKDMIFDSKSAKLFIKKDLNLKVNINTKFKKIPQKTFITITKVKRKEDIYKISDYLNFRFDLKKFVIDFKEHGIQSCIP